MNLFRVTKISFAVVMTVFFIGCGGTKKEKKNEVVVHELSDTDMLNPVNYQSADAGYYAQKLFSTLMIYDPKTLELIPYLATALPQVEADTATKATKYTYEIREGAKWDNGTDITAKDAEFSLKVYKCPLVNNEQNKPYFESISEIITYPDNPRKFSVVCNKIYHINMEISGDFFFLPAYVYDPKGLLSEFPLKDFGTKYDELAANPKIKEFANEFNSDKFQREKGFVVGSGAYEFDSWQPGVKLILKKKKDWWGEKYRGENKAFEINVDKLVYQTINDQTAALVALKGGKLDVMYGIKAKDWVTDVTQSDKIKQNYQLSTPPSMAYTYFGLNMRNPKFSDKRVRKALAHLVDVDKIIKVVGYGLGQRTVGFVHPSKKIFYNDTIKFYDFNVEKAKQLLTDAGWKDSNGNGTLDKMIDGQLTEFNITFTYNSGNDARRDAALIFKESAREVGINVDVVPQEWSIYIQNQKNHNFEMYYGAWISSVGESDPKQIFHTESINGGSNYCYFGNAESDAVIEALRSELDKDKRAGYYKALQAIIHEEVPYIHLSAPQERIAISKRFQPYETSALRPGFFEETFKLVESAD
jgi:peptide/nickel transport system substrate-binding protein